MTERYKTLSAVFPIILINEEGSCKVLLLKRANTGYMDGFWDFAGSGHVDENETATQAVIREAKEEINITVLPSDVEFAHLTHRLGKNGGKTYYDIYFLIKSFCGTPIIAEPDKCSDLKWFDINELPQDMIEIRKNAFEEYRRSEFYSEIVE